MTEHEHKGTAAGWQSVNQAPDVGPGDHLQPSETATTVRPQDGQTLSTDGPFVEAKAALDGYRPPTATPAATEHPTPCTPSSKVYSPPARPLRAASERAIGIRRHARVSSSTRRLA